MAELTENLIRLRSVGGVGNALIWRLIRRFGDSERALHASVDELRQVKGISANLAEAIREARTHDPRPEMERAVDADAIIIPYDDPLFPKALLYTYDPPVLLYVKGTLTRDDNLAVGIVGTREASPYGRDNALELGAALARGGYTVVSGLALGVDTFAHIGAMNGGGRTIGVLGCGFDHMYPEQNRDLALEMTRYGAVITEYAMATRPSRETFPMRNRIIAGMSYGLLVIEAPLRSGSLITARLANEFGRTVFAIPGRMGDAGSEGCNKLIRDGAVMVTSVDDIFTELNPALPPPPFERKGGGSGGRKRRDDSNLFAGPRGEPDAGGKTPPAAAKAPATKPEPALDDQERLVLGLLGDDWKSADDLMADAGLPGGKTMAVLAMLKLKRLAEQGPGQTYRLRKS